MIAESREERGAEREQVSGSTMMGSFATLFENGRYEESRGSKSGAFSGTYAVQRSRIDYLDDGGFFGYGELINGALHHGGMVLRRARSLVPITPRKAESEDRFHASLNSLNVDA